MARTWTPAAKLGGAAKIRTWGWGDGGMERELVVGGHEGASPPLSAFREPAAVHGAGQRGEGAVNAGW